MLEGNMTESKLTKEEIDLLPIPELSREIGSDDNRKTFLEKIGEALGGRHWQSDMAREAKKSKSQITRYINRERTPNVAFGRALDRIMVDKIEDVSKFIGYRGSPSAGKPNVIRGLDLIRQGIAALRETSPRVKRLTIDATSTRTQPPGKKKQG